MKLEIYKDGTGKWRWRIRAGNNKIIGGSTEGYETQQGARNNLNILRRGFTQHNYTVRVVED